MDSCFNFLDVTIRFIDGQFRLHTYRKPTFTGLGLSFTSFIPLIYKTNSIFTLLNRAFLTCTDWKLFHKEVQFLLNYFLQNRYPKEIIHRAINKFVAKKVNPKLPILTAPKQKFNVVLPFYGPISKEIEKKLQHILGNSFPHTDFRLVSTNKQKLQNLFLFKDKVPKMLKSCVTYLFTCDCSKQYIGSTAVNFHTRMCQHLGISERTGKERKVKHSSAIRDHCEKEGHELNFDQFKIIGNTTYDEDVRLLEAIQIKVRQPTLNKQMESLCVFSI